MAPELDRSGDTRVRVIPLSTSPGEVQLPEDPGVPNLVYKYPAVDWGVGVNFLRARDENHAVALARELDRTLGEKPGLFQPWVSSPFLPGRRIWESRSHVLVSPVGNQFLGARRRETVNPMPERLEEGVVEDRKPFLNNGMRGSVHMLANPVDQAVIGDGTMGVADGLANILTRGFVTRP